MNLLIFNENILFFYVCNKLRQRRNREFSIRHVRRKNHCKIVSFVTHHLFLTTEPFVVKRIFILSSLLFSFLVWLALMFRNASQLDEEVGIFRILARILSFPELFKGFGF